MKVKVVTRVSNYGHGEGSYRDTFIVPEEWVPNPVGYANCHSTYSVVETTVEDLLSKLFELTGHPLEVLPATATPAKLTFGEPKT